MIVLFKINFDEKVKVDVLCYSCNNSTCCGDKHQLVCSVNAARLHNTGSLECPLSPYHLKIQVNKILLRRHIVPHRANVPGAFSRHAILRCVIPSHAIPSSADHRLATPRTITSLAIPSCVIPSHVIPSRVIPSRVISSLLSLFTFPSTFPCTLCILQFPQ